MISLHLSDPKDACKASSQDGPLLAPALDELHLLLKGALLVSTHLDLVAIHHYMMST